MINEFEFAWFCSIHIKAIAISRLNQVKLQSWIEMKYQMLKLEYNLMEFEGISHLLLNSEDLAVMLSRFEMVWGGG